MAIRAIDHVNIVTTDLEGTVAFYAEAIGLERGWRPDFSFPGAWLYAGERPVIHLAVGERAAGFAAADAGVSGTGPLDHVAFDAEDFEGTRDRLVRGAWITGSATSRARPSDRSSSSTRTA
jgi:catechol 2,3-dioxygenase-like lactoylglutathione lyase family enzyme